MIKSFADRETKKLLKDRRAKLVAINAATNVEELRTPAGIRLHKLEGDRAGRRAIAVNQQYRISFGFEGGDAYDVEKTDFQ